MMLTGSHAPMPGAKGGVAGWRPSRLFPLQVM
jgi:hypothetical protein